MRAGLLIGLVVLALTATLAAQRGPARPALPPLSMTCTVHPEVIESRAGKCPMCGRTLVPVRLDIAWMCPVHTTVTDADPGTCRICRRDLIRVTAAITW